MTDRQTKTVIKIGGNEIDDPQFLKMLTETLVALAGSGALPPVVVHGGGKEIASLQNTLGLQPEFVDGLRVTSEETLAPVIMTLCGTVNKRLVSALVLAGLDAVGMSGLDRGLVRAEKLEHPSGDLGRVGVPVAVRGDILDGLLNEGVTPIVAPVCLGPDGPTNVNADQVAGAIAAELGADLFIVTNVPGVLVQDTVVEKLTAARARQLIEEGLIRDGMLPKVRSALAALATGAPSAHILNLSGWRDGGGTRLVV